MGKVQKDTEMLAGLLAEGVSGGQDDAGVPAQQIAASRNRWLIFTVVIVTLVALAFAWYVLSAPGMPLGPADLPIQGPTPTLGIPPTATPVP